MLLLRWFRNLAPVEAGSLSHDLQGFIHLRWLFGISEPSTVSPCNTIHENHLKQMGALGRLYVIEVSGL